MGKIKVAWVCHLSNPELRERIQIRTNPLEPLFYKIVKRERGTGVDSAIWNTNAINEIKLIADVELHIVSPVRNLAKMRQDFSIDGVQYHFVRDENSALSAKVLRYLLTRNSSEFRTNRKRIVKVVEEIKPDIVHIIGAENPYYSLSLLDLPDTYPTILQLQALLMSLGNNVSSGEAKNYDYKGKFEKELILRANYVGTLSSSYVSFIREHISRDVKIVNTTLAMAQKFDLTERKCEYDFVHYAGGLRPAKGTDIAIEAFAIAHKLHPDISLDLIGGMDDDFRQTICSRIEELGIKNNVFFEGLLPTHDDVLAQIRKSRFALLPLKIDIVPNTIHEAMANGLPVLTTVTPGTPLLNARRQSVMISPVGDFEDIARNMIQLLDNKTLADTLRLNAAQTEAEHANNHDIISHWVEVYKAIIKNHIDGTPIPSEFLL